MKETAAGLAALGRGPDTMLVHMSPREVDGLQQLAMAHGGSLTTNPHTGLPEAGFLSDILPTVLGVGLSFIPGMTPLMAGLGVGGLQAARTGDIGKGLMAGLGAFGGAGLGGALSGMGAVANASPAAFEAAQSNLGPAAEAMSKQAVASTIPGQSATANAMTGLQQLGQPGGMSQLGSGLMEQYGGKMGAAAAGIGALGALGGFEQPQLGFAAPQQQPSNYRKQVANRRPYDPTAPGGYYYTDRGILQPQYAAKGGEIHSVPQLEDGGFVLTKKAVDGIGKGDNEKGQRRAAAGLGAIPIKGPGTGTSDSIPTTIDGKRPALVSNGEAYVPRREVKKRGGAKKFYAMMKKAEQAANRA